MRSRVANGQCDGPVAQARKAHKWGSSNRVVPLQGLKPYNKPAVTQAEQNFLAYASVLEKVLHTRTFLVGHRVSLADIVLAGHLVRPFATVLDPSFRSSHPNTLRYFNTIVNQPEFLAVLGSSGPSFAEKKLEYTAPKKEPKAAPAAAAAAVPKAEKKKAAKKDDDDDDEPAAPAEPKAKHPCEALGPAKAFPLDEWKRTYSNLEFSKAMDWLSSNINESEYTFWRVTYKVRWRSSSPTPSPDIPMPAQYNDELTQVFMSGEHAGPSDDIYA